MHETRQNDSTILHTALDTRYCIVRTNTRLREISRITTVTVLRHQLLHSTSTNHTPPTNYNDSAACPCCITHLNTLLLLLQFVTPFTLTLYSSCSYTAPATRLILIFNLTIVLDVVSPKAKVELTPPPICTRQGDPN